MKYFSLVSNVYSLPIYSAPPPERRRPHFFFLLSAPKTVSLRAALRSPPLALSGQDAVPLLPGEVEDPSVFQLPFLCDRTTATPRVSSCPPIGLLPTPSLSFPCVPPTHRLALTPHDEDSYTFWSTQPTRPTRSPPFVSSAGSVTLLSCILFGFPVELLAQPPTTHLLNLRCTNHRSPSHRQTTTRHPTRRFCQVNALGLILSFHIQQPSILWAHFLSESVQRSGTSSHATH